MKLSLEKNSKILMSYFLGFFILPFVLPNIIQSISKNESQLNTLVLLFTYLIISVAFVIVINKAFIEELMDFLKPKKLIYMLLTAISLIITFYFLDYIYSILGIEGTSINQESLEEIFKNNASLFIFTTVILAPFVEEIVYRKVLLNIFKERYNTLLAIIISSSFFGFIHVSSGDFIYLPAYFSLSCILGYSYSRTNNIFIVVFGHSIYNLFTICLM